MDLKTRIRRRQYTGEGTGLVVEYDAISPVAHVEEPTGRGPVLGRLLDYMDPVFDGKRPPNAYVWGPPGSGKSAVIRALFDHMARLLSGSGPVIHTTTRAQTTRTPEFVYVDARMADSEFGLYHDVLDAVSDESVPQAGVGTDEIRSQLIDRLRRKRRGAVVAVDHVNEPGGPGVATVSEAFSVIEDKLTWVAVGRRRPEEVPEEVRPPARVEIPRYERPTLVDILTARASEGLARGAIEHEQIRRLAAWAEGDAHDALAALLGAAELASEADQDRIRERDLDQGMNAVPRPSAPLGRLLTLPDNRQLVLRKLIDLTEDESGSVEATATAIAGRPDVDLSAGTVKRFCYELAEVGIVERVTAPTGGGAGRPPSRLEPRFPTLVFRRLYDLQHQE